MTKFVNKKFSVATGFCSRDCKHQGNKEKCSDCHRINGKDTEFEPSDEK